MITAAIYARTSTREQSAANQIPELRQYARARGWQVCEFIDEGVSGARDRRPALDEMLKQARRRKIDAILCWRLDRLGRSLRHLVLTLEELESLNITFVSLNEGIDFGTAAGKLQLHVLAALSEFERARISERVHAGMERARRNGRRIGRPRRRITDEDLRRTTHLSVRNAAAAIGVSRAVLHRARQATS